MNIKDKLLSIFSARPKNSPEPLTIPNQWFNWFNRKAKNAPKSTLPKNPTATQLRNFAKNSVVRRPIAIIEDTITRLPYELNNVNKADTNDYQRQKQIALNIIANPNVVHSWTPFIKLILEDLVTLDAGVFEKAIGGNPDRPLFLYPTDGASVQFVVPYDYTSEDSARYAQAQPLETKFFSSKQLGYLQRNYFTDRPEGLSPILAAYNYIVYFLDANERANGVATNATADFLVSLGKNVTGTEREAFTEYMVNEIEGTGKIPVIAGSEGIDTKQIRAINKDGLYQAWQEFLLTIIAISFGIPPQKLGVITTNDRSTAEDLDNIIMTELVLPYSTIIEDAVNEHILKPLGYDKLFKFSFVYTESEASKKLKSDRVTNEFEKGVITENEARVSLGHAKRDSKYADVSYSEAKGMLNVDYNPNPMSSGGGSDGTQGIAKDNGEKIKKSG